MRTTIRFVRPGWEHSGSKGFTPPGHGNDCGATRRHTMKIPKEKAIIHGQITLPEIGPFATTEELTAAEIEELRQDKRDALALLQKKYYPNVKLR
jgi:hypothetical protein